jgi:hypothetical protein
MTIIQPLRSSAIAKSSPTSAHSLAMSPSSNSVFHRTFMAQFSSLFLTRIIQAVTNRSQPRLVVLPIDESAAAGLDGCRFAAEGDHATAMQPPKQAGCVVAAQAPIAWVRINARFVEAE